MAKAGHKTDIMRLIVDSEKFPDLQYEMIDNHIVVRAGDNGLFCVSRESAPEFHAEFGEVIQVWGDVRT